MNPKASDKVKARANYPKREMALQPVDEPHDRVQYSCPMHPEVVSDHPGSCPKCGMALEPRTVSVEEGPNPELVDMTRCFWVGLVLSLPVFVVAMSGMLPGHPLRFLDTRRQQRLRADSGGRS
jgi:Cu+-exporting ATPase